MTNLNRVIVGSGAGDKRFVVNVSATGGDR